MKKKVLLISQYFLPDINAASFRMNDLYNALLEEDFSVTVITATPQKSSIEVTESNSDINRIELKKIESKSFFNYLRNYFGFMFKSIFYTFSQLRKEKFDYIIVTSPPLFVALGGLIISIFKRAKLIVDIRDIWPDSAVSAGMLRSNGLLYKITKWIEKLIYKKSDIITCVSKPMSTYIIDESNHQNVNILYNGISPDVENYNHKSLKQSISTNSMISISYAGNIGIVQNMNIIIEVAKQLIEEDYEFNIVGDGIERKSLEKKAKQLKLNNVIFCGTLPKNETLNQLKKADLLFFSLIEDPVFEKTIPSKLFDYLLINKPIITSIRGQGREILEYLGCAIFFEPNDPTSLVKAIQTYSSNREDYQKKALYNREYVIKYFNRKEIFKEFLQNVKNNDIDN